VERHCWPLAGAHWGLVCARRRPLACARCRPVAALPDGRFGLRPRCLGETEVNAVFTRTASALARRGQQLCRRQAAISERQRAAINERQRAAINERQRVAINERRRVAITS
jgi:hypothetical protein